MYAPSRAKGTGRRHRRQERDSELFGNDFRLTNVSNVSHDINIGWGLECTNQATNHHNADTRAAVGCLETPEDGLKKFTTVLTAYQCVSRFVSSFSGQHAATACPIALARLTLSFVKSIRLGLIQSGIVHEPAPLRLDS